MTRATWTAAPVGEERHRLGEGPHWDASRGRLSWVDIVAGSLWEQQDGTTRTTALGEALGVAVPHVDGGWVCGLGQGIALVGDGGEVLRRVQLEDEDVRMNDGKCDARGRFFVGSKAHDNRPGAGSLWRLALDGSVTKALDGLTISNGLGWSPDRTTMYVTDSAPGRVDAYDYDLATGELGARRPFLQLPDGDGSPDGLAVDAAGDVWVAVWGAGEVRRYAPSGEQTGLVQVGSSLVTSCAFAGADLTSLAITTAWDELTDEQRAQQPDAGRRYVADVGVAGTAGEPCRVAGWSARSGD